MSDFRKMYLYVGMPRGGKSFFNKQVMNLYCQNEGACLVYNYGKESDFPLGEYIEIKPLSIREHKRMLPKNMASEYSRYPTIEFFYLGRGRNRKVYRFRDWVELFSLSRKKVRMKKIANRTEENLFFQTVCKYICKTYIMFDDCRSTLRNFNSNHTEFFSRINHSGEFTPYTELQGYGCDVATIWHSLDTVNSEIIDYCTDYIIFKQKNMPKFKKFNDETTVEILSELTKKLNSMKQFSCFHFNTETQIITEATLNI